MIDFKSRRAQKIYDDMECIILFEKEKNENPKIKVTSNDSDAVLGGVAAIVHTLYKEAGFDKEKILHAIKLALN